MKFLSTMFLLAAALVCSASMTFGQLLVQEDFNYTPGTDLSANTWSKASTLPSAFVNNGGLVYPGYIGSGAGNAASFTKWTDRYSKSMSVPAAGNIYAAFMLRVDTATANGGYIAYFWSNNAGRGRFWIKNDGAGNLKFGVSGKSASAPVTYDPASYVFGTTYLVVLKYSIITGTTNDTYTIIVNPVPGAVEPLPSMAALTDAGSDLGANTSGSSFSIQNRDSLGALGAAFVIDGIRVGQNWNEVVPPPPYYYNGTGAIDNVASWGVNNDGTGKHPSDFAADNQLYSLKNTNKVTLSSLWLVSGVASKLIVGSGVNFVIGLGGYLSGTVDIDGGGTLTLTGSDWPTIGSNAGVVAFDNAAGMPLSDNKVLPASSGYYDLKSGDIFMGGYSLTVKGRLRCNANKIAGTGTFILDSAGTIYISSPNGITASAAAGDVQSSVRKYSRYGNYQYVGAVNQVTGDGLPDTVANLTVAMANRNLLTTLSKSVVVTSNLGMQLGKYKLGTFNLTFSNPANQSDSSYVITDGTGSLIRTVVSTSTSAKTMPVGSLTEYRKVAFTLEAAATGNRNFAVRYISGDTASVGFPKGITYRYKGGYWSIKSDSAINPTYRLDVDAPFGFADSTVLRIITRADNTKAWDTVGTVGSYFAGVQSQAGIGLFGQFALGVGAAAPPPAPGKRYQGEVFSAYQVQSGIQYGVDAKQTLDLYTGTGDLQATGRPLVIFIPGGGFKGVNAAGGFSNIFNGGLAKCGYVVANINYYRTSSSIVTDSVHFETMLKALQDVKAAVRFLRKNGVSYGIDTSQIFVSGSSAGSITAMHLAYLDSAEVPKNSVNWSNIGGTFEGTERGTPGVSTRISGVVSNWGAIGDTAWMKTGNVPVYCTHGTLDSTVYYDLIPADGPFKYSDKYIFAAAKNRGITTGLHVFYGAGHTLTNAAGATDANTSVRQDSAYKDARTFLYSLLKSTTTGVDQATSMVPTEFMLHQNYPNPFNPSTTISYGIPAAMKVSMAVYNILGQEVMTLVNEMQTAGMHAVTFDASRMSSGVYFYRLTAASTVATKKMVLLK